MEEMENNKQVKKVSTATRKKREEEARQKIAFNLDNFMIATDICIAVLQVEGTSEEVKNKANETLLATLDKILGL
jgi:hypothetical protein